MTLEARSPADIRVPAPRNRSHLTLLVEYQTLAVALFCAVSLIDFMKGNKDQSQKAT